MDSFFVQDPLDNSNHPENHDSRSAEHSTQPAHGLHARGLRRKPPAFVGMAMAAFIVVGLAASIWSVGVSQELRQQAAGERVAPVPTDLPSASPANPPQNFNETAELLQNIKEGKVDAPVPQTDPGAPPMASDAIEADVFVLAWGGPTEPSGPDPYVVTNDESIPWLEHMLEWATVFGGWAPQSGDVARVNINFPFPRIQYPDGSNPPNIGGALDYQTLLTSPTYSPVAGQSLCQLAALPETNPNHIDEVWLYVNGQGTVTYKTAVMAGPPNPYNDHAADNTAFETIYPRLVGSETYCPTAMHIMGLAWNSYTEARSGIGWTYTDPNIKSPSFDDHLYPFAIRFSHTAAYFLDNNPLFNLTGLSDADGHDDFLQYDRTHGYHVPNPSPSPVPYTPPRSCGNAEHTPNTTSYAAGSGFYDHGGQLPNRITRSDCTNDRTTWSPVHSFVPTVANVDCWNWNCFKETYLLWWMQHFPNKTNTYCKLDNTAMPDWWEMMYENRQVPGQGGTNCPPLPPSPVPTPSPSPSPVPTPSPSPSPVPTPSPSPTPVPTPSPSPSPVPTPSPSPTPVPTPSPSPSPIPTPTPVPTPTPPPATLTTSQGCQAGKATIYTNWTTIPGATSYSLEKCQGTTCTPTPYATTSVPYYVDQAKFVLGSSYRYRVRGYYGTLPGSYSNVVTTTFRVSCSITP